MVLDLEVQAHPQKFWFAENLENLRKNCLTSKNGAKFMIAKIAGNALKQGVEHTQWYVSAVHNCKNTRLRECLIE